MFNLATTPLWSSAAPVITNAAQTLGAELAFSQYSLLLVRTSIVVPGGAAGPFAVHVVPVAEFAARNAHLGMGGHSAEMVQDSDNTWHRAGDSADLGIEAIHGLQAPGSEFTAANATKLTAVGDFALGGDPARLPEAKLPALIPASALPEARLVPDGTPGDVGRVVGFDAGGGPRIQDAADITHNGAVDLAAVVAALRTSGALTGQVLVIGNGDNLAPRAVNLGDWSGALDAAYRAGEIPDAAFSTSGDVTYLTFTRPS